jgi:4-cresol dehydrogenase (hydroxylating) flavoprotein subunit
MGGTDLLDALRAVAGAGHLITDPDVLARAATATFPTAARVRAVVRPADAGEVQGCVLAANAHRVPLYPVSGGRNWGLGSRVPVADGSVVLDLGRLERIVGPDEGLGWITVGPGVTFGQCHDHLRERGSRLWLAGIGGPSSASVVGNVLERGDGFGPHGERLAHACGFEVVLPMGELLRTGFGRFPEARARHLSRDAPGPVLEGLFTQSNLGIVTSMTLWLMRRPRRFSLLRCRVDRLARLGPLLDGLRELMMDGVIRDHCASLWNAYKMLPVMGRYPWMLTGGRTPLSLAALGRSEPWFASVGLYAASAAHAEADGARVREVLAGHVDALELRALADETEVRGEPARSSVSPRTPICARSTGASARRSLARWIRTATGAACCGSARRYRSTGRS